MVGQARRVRVSIADALTALRLPTAVAFFVVQDAGWRLGLLAVGALTDLLDGQIARRFGSSRFGAFLDPVADRLFMLCVFGAIMLSGALQPYEILGVLLRDLVASFAFAVVTFTGRPASIPARAGGKAVTVLQLLTVLAWLFGSRLVHELAWATTGVGLYAIWDYVQAAKRERRTL